jgi:hypothetical protein
MRGCKQCSLVQDNGVVRNKADSAVEGAIVVKGCELGVDRVSRSDSRSAWQDEPIRCYVALRSGPTSSRCVLPVPFDPLDVFQ